jgi:hypothetical protein
VKVRKGHATDIHELIDQLLTQGEAPAWRFSPGQLKLDAGGTITASNRGGEFHTFSEVAAFGGGCIPELNELLGLDPVPECSIGDIFQTTGVAPRGSLTTGPLGAAPTYSSASSIPGRGRPSSRADASSEEVWHHLLRIRHDPAKTPRANQKQS